MSFKNACKRRSIGQSTVEYFILAAGIVGLVALTNNALLSNMVSAGQDLVDRASDKMNGGGGGSGDGGDGGDGGNTDPRPDPGLPQMD